MHCLNQITENYVTLDFQNDLIDMIFFLLPPSQPSPRGEGVPNEPCPLGGNGKGGKMGNYLNICLKMLLRNYPYINLVFISS
jgi:hypothetical protein